MNARIHNPKTALSNTEVREHLSAASILINKAIREFNLVANNTATTHSSESAYMAHELSELLSSDNNQAGLNTWIETLTKKIDNGIR